MSYSIRAYSAVGILVACAALLARAQHDGSPNAILAEKPFARVSIPRLSQAPTLEDFADMRPASPLANQMLRIDKFTGRLPVDDIPSSEPTQVYLGYDSVNIYAVFLCFDSQPAKMRARRPSLDSVFD